MAYVSCINNKIYIQSTEMHFTTIEHMDRPKSGYFITCSKLKRGWNKEKLSFIVKF